MDKIEYVRILSEDEIIKFKQNLKKRYEKIADINVAISHSVTLLAEYQLLEQEEISKFRTTQLELIERYKLWERKTCLCGKLLIFNLTYGFWGCPDYKNESIKHVTFRHNQNEILASQFRNNKIRIHANWCSSIIDKVGIKGQLRAKTLLEYFEFIGLEDLRSKYGYKPTIENISTYVKANLKSKSEEQEIRDFLLRHFSKVSYQIYFEYKFINQSPKVKIADIITSDDISVYLIEIKRHNIYIDITQIRLYKRLLSHLMHEKNDLRIVKNLFVVNEIFESVYNFNNCILFNNLKKLKNKEEIVNLFNAHALM